MKSVFYKHKYLLNRHLIICSYFVFAFSFFILAGEDEYTIRYLTVDDGLSYNRVTTILQDHYGFMWIGSQGGLDRYNGYGFETYIPGFGIDINPSIERIFEDSKGNLWIGTKSGGLHRYTFTDEKFEKVLLSPDSSNEANFSRIMSFCEDKKGMLWIGTWFNGIYKLDIDNEKVEHYLNNQNVSEIIVTKEDEIMITTYSGLWQFDPELDKFNNILAYPADGCPCYVSIEEDPDSSVLWIGRWSYGLIKYNYRSKKRKVFEKVKNSKKRIHNPYSLKIDSDGNLWIGTWGDGLYQLDRSTGDISKINFELLYNGLSIKHNVILDIYEDVNNNIWIGSNEAGIAIISEKLPFNNISSNLKPEFTDNVIGILETDNGNLFISTVFDGLFWSKDRYNFSKILRNDGYPISNGYLLYKSVTNKIWVGAGYFFEITWKNNIPVLKRMSDIYSSERLNLSKPRCILEKGDSILIGTLQNSLYLFKWKNNSISFVKQFPVKPGEPGFLQHSRINDMYLDSTSRIWIGTYDGLYILGDTNVISIENYIISGKKLSSSTINCINQDVSGNIWVGTPFGLNVLIQDSSGNFDVKYYTTENGLDNNYIRGVQTDNEGNLWISTSKGLSKFLPNDEVFRNFHRSDGIRLFDFSFANYKNREGELFFGGIGGLVYFDPSKITEQKTRRNICFTSFSILNSPVKPGQKVNNRVILDASINETDEIVLTHHENEFSFTISSFNYNTPGRDQYAYKLENYNKEWVNLGMKNRMAFKNLNPGKYILRIKNHGKLDNNCSEERALKIKILAPWWKTWYALGIYIIVIVAIVLIVRWTAIKQVHLSNSIELLKVNREKENAINEMKLRFFTNISHEFRTPLTLIIAPLNELIRKSGITGLSGEASGKLRIIQKNASRLLNLVNQLLEFRKAESGYTQLEVHKTDIIEYVNEICIDFKELAKINQIDFKIEAEIESGELWFDRKLLEIILNNLISNSFKFIGENGKITLKITGEDNYIKIHIIDNGIGIPKNELKNIFVRFHQLEKESSYGSSGIGLALVKKLVELHSGKIEVESEPGFKTEFIVSLLKGKNHFNENQLAKQSFLKKTKDRNNDFVLPVEQKKGIQEKKSGSTILIAEDNHEIRDYLIGLLSPLYQIISTEDGEMAFDKILTHLPDLIVSDIMMPKIDGIELSRKVKNNNRSAHIPIVLLTAKSAGQFEIVGLQHGADAYISKPFDPELLIEKIKALLRSHQNLKRIYGRTVKLESTKVEITSHEEKLVKNAIKIIEKNLLNPEFNALYLAESLNLSQSSLYRKLKDISGLTINELIRKIRLDFAAQLLKDKEKRISQVALEVGFNDITYFRNCFQKQFNATPGEYRKSIQNNML